MNSKEITFCDKLGQPILPGSIIAYGHALGRCAGIRIGKVTKVAQKEDEYYKTLHCRITVRGVDDDWESRPPQLTTKKGTLMFPERIIVLDPTKIPDTHKELLNSVSVDQ